MGVDLSNLRPTMTNKKRGIVMLFTLEEVIEAEYQRQESEIELGSFSDTELVNGSSSNDD
tara:strand:+ start:291 stop:470 length:180 start_codon:yes stop_codon:yes gene_type:complete